MDPITAAAGFGTAQVAKKQLSQILSDLSSAATNAVKKKLRQWATQQQIDELYKKIRQIRMVKTILQPERAVDLKNFYYPSRISLTENEHRAINDLTDLPDKRRMLPRLNLLAFYQTSDLS